MRILSLPLAIASLAFAAVPHKFTAGTAAKADSVNANFEYLDNALKSKANQAGLDSLVSRVNSSPTVAGKASQGSVDTLKQLVSTKADTSELSAVKKSLSGLATTSSLTDALKLKANQAGLDSLVSRVNSSPSAAGKASQGSVDTLKQIVATKADMSEVSSIKTSISGLATTKALNDSLARISTDVTALKTGKADQSWVSSNFPMINASKELLAGDAVVVGSSATTGSTIRIEPGGLNNFGIWTTNGKGWSIQEDISDGSFQLHWFDGKQSGYTPFQVTPTGDITMGGSAKTVTVSSHLVVSSSITVKGTQMTVPDYVFEPDYKLAPLSEVEAYTQENKHLPEVPSAAEIEKGGLDLTQMNFTLLKKVEELTLHAIAQQKQIEAQNARIQTLESKLPATP